jgi:hypothetical protein
MEAQLLDFMVMVWGWFPENEHNFGGSPEKDDILFVEAINESSAIKLACARFDAMHGFEHVEGEVRA